jgi:pyridoxal phosphate enzyme (YggS family)
LHAAEARDTLQGFVDRISAVRARIDEAAIRAGRDPAGVQIVGASKEMPAERLRFAVAAGLVHLGENRVQEAIGKITALGDLEPLPTWHMLGHLQSNKARHVARLFEWVHSLDSVALAGELDRRRAAVGRPIQVLVEVNTTGEASKYGVTPEACLDLLGELAVFPNLRIMGLMTLGRWSPDPEAARVSFRQLRELRDRARQRYPELPLDHLSMGMSGDFEVAVEEGATWVRVGTGIFGPRPPHRRLE